VGEAVFRADGVVVVLSKGRVLKELEVRAAVAARMGPADRGQRLECAVRPSAPTGAHGMSIARALLGSTRGRLALGALVCYLAWQGWLGLAAPGKIAVGLNTEAEKVNIIVTLPFPPERFHVIVFQRYGRVSGTQDNSIEVSDVKKADLHTVARPYRVTRVEPLPTGGG